MARAEDGEQHGYDGYRRPCRWRQQIAAAEGSDDRDGQQRSHAGDGRQEEPDDADMLASTGRRRAAHSRR